MKKAIEVFEAHFIEGGYQYSDDAKDNARGWFVSGFMAAQNLQRIEAQQKHMSDINDPRLSQLTPSKIETQFRYRCHTCNFSTHNPIWAREHTESTTHRNNLLNQNVGKITVSGGAGGSNNV